MNEIPDEIQLNICNYLREINDYNSFRISNKHFYKIVAKPEISLSPYTEMVQYGKTCNLHMKFTSYTQDDIDNGYVNDIVLTDNELPNKNIDHLYILPIYSPRCINIEHILNKNIAVVLQENTINLFSFTNDTNVKLNSLFFTSFEKNKLFIDNFYYISTLIINYEFIIELDANLLKHKHFLCVTVNIFDKKIKNLLLQKLKTDKLIIFSKKYITVAFENLYINNSVKKLILNNITVNEIDTKPTNLKIIISHNFDNILNRNRYIHEYKFVCNLYKHYSNFNISEICINDNTYDRNSASIVHIQQNSVFLPVQCSNWIACNSNKNSILSNIWFNTKLILYVCQTTSKRPNCILHGLNNKIKKLVVVNDTLYITQKLANELEELYIDNSVVYFSDNIIHFPKLKKILLDNIKTLKYIPGPYTTKIIRENVIKFLLHLFPFFSTYTLHYKIFWHVLLDIIVKILCNIKNKNGVTLICPNIDDNDSDNVIYNNNNNNNSWFSTITKFFSQFGYIDDSISISIKTKNTITKIR